MTIISKIFIYESANMEYPMPLISIAPEESFGATAHNGKERKER
jgi:hypothetical protein